MGDAAELDDGEFGGEFTLEGVDGAADFGEGHGVTSTAELFAWMDGIGDWIGTVGPRIKYLTGVGIRHLAGDLTLTPALSHQGRGGF